MPVTHKYGSLPPEDAVKTTLELPDDLLRRAKAAAATRGVSLKTFFTEALERRLQSPRGGAQPTWKQLSGGLASLRRETARIRQLVDEEFEQVDDEDSE